ncbi:hypothetical protein ABZ833_25840, partial [Streptomyces sp. NPDC047525]
MGEPWSCACLRLEGEANLELRLRARGGGAAGRRGGGAAGRRGGGAAGRRGGGPSLQLRRHRSRLAFVYGRAGANPGAAPGGRGAAGRACSCAATGRAWRSSTDGRGRTLELRLAGAGR